MNTAINAVLNLTYKAPPTPETIARVLGCTVEQAKAGLLKSARNIRSFSDKELKRWGKTRSEAETIAANYEKRGQS